MNGLGTLERLTDRLLTVEAALEAEVAQNEELRKKVVALMGYLKAVVDGTVLPAQVAVDLTPGAETVTVRPLTGAMSAALAERDAAVAFYLEHFARHRLPAPAELGVTTEHCGPPEGD